MSAPRVIYQPDPEYSEEARKAKYQGTWVSWLVVGPDGRPRDLRVARSLGLGLDEKAIEAVKTWKFEPAMKNGQPVAVQINVELASGCIGDFRETPNPSAPGLFFQFHVVLPPTVSIPPVPQAQS